MFCGFVLLSQAEGLGEGEEDDFPNENCNIGSQQSNNTGSQPDSESSKLGIIFVVG